MCGGVRTQEAEHETIRRAQRQFGKSACSWCRMWLFLIQPLTRYTLCVRVGEWMSNFPSAWSHEAKYYHCLDDLIFIYFFSFFFFFNFALKTTINHFPQRKSGHYSHPKRVCCTRHHYLYLVVKEFMSRVSWVAEYPLVTRSLFWKNLSHNWKLQAAHNDTKHWPFHCNAVLFFLHLGLCVDAM